MYGKRSGLARPLPKYPKPLGIIQHFTYYLSDMLQTICIGFIETVDFIQHMDTYSRPA